MEPAIEVDAHVLQRVADAANEKVAPKGARQADACASAGFIVNIVQTLEVPFTMVQVHTQRQLAPQKPRFDKGNQIILPLSADLHTQPEFLSAAGESWRVEQIEIALIYFRETDDGIDRT